jgi:hypothetical protein
MSAAENGLSSPALTSFNNICNSVRFFRAQFIFKQSQPARRCAAGRPRTASNVTTGRIAAALAQSSVKCRTLPFYVFLRTLR